MIVKLCKKRDRLCVSWSSWHESRGLAHVLMVWCVVCTAPCNLQPWEEPEDDWITVETCSPIVISENKCCADVKNWYIYKYRFFLSAITSHSKARLALLARDILCQCTVQSFNCPNHLFIQNSFNRVCIIAFLTTHILKRIPRKDQNNTKL
jgi:hypothetical protein